MVSDRDVQNKAHTKLGDAFALACWQPIMIVGPKHPRQIRNVQGPPASKEDTLRTCGRVIGWDATSSQGVVGSVDYKKEPGVAKMPAKQL